MERIVESIIEETEFDRWYRIFEDRYETYLELRGFIDEEEFIRKYPDACELGFKEFVEKYRLDEDEDDDEDEDEDEEAKPQEAKEEEAPLPQPAKEEEEEDEEDDALPLKKHFKYN
jgi:hypothetical protein